MFLAKNERKREKTVQYVPARNLNLEPQRAPLELGEQERSGAGGHPAGPAGTCAGTEGTATLAQAGGGARDNVSREVPLFNSYHFFIK